MAKSPYEWLDREVHPRGPFVAMCLTLGEFEDACKHLGQTAGKDEFTQEGAAATTWEFKTPRGPTCIVCFKDPRLSVGRPLDGWEIASLLVHEAVHIWQTHCKAIGESRPAVEQEAYGIQYIAGELMREFARRVAAAPGGNPWPPTK